MASGTFEIVGAQALGKQLEGLTDKLRGSVIRKALKRAADPIHRAALIKVPEKTGALADALIVTTFWNKRAGTLGATIGVSPKSAYFKKNQFYAGFVEYGHRIGKRIKGVERAINRIRRGRKSFGQQRLSEIETDALRTEFGDTRNRVPAYPFIRPAWDENKDKAAAIIVTEIKAGIERETKKVAKAAAAIK